MNCCYHMKILWGLGTVFVACICYKWAGLLMVELPNALFRSWRCVLSARRACCDLHFHAKFMWPPLIKLLRIVEVPVTPPPVTPIPPRINNESSFWGCYDFVTCVRGVLRFLSRRLEGGVSRNLSWRNTESLPPTHYCWTPPRSGKKRCVTKGILGVVVTFSGSFP